MKRGVILIAGPTASGKSRAALALAERVGGEVVNADALAVYRDLAILSARPSPADEAIAPHRLYGHVDGARRHSVGEWLKDAEPAIAAITGRGKAAIIAGGTGLYFRALERGLSEAPDVSEDVRRAAAARLDEIGLPKFREEVLSFDPEMARLDAADRQRHLRAWEVFHAGGVPLSSIQQRPGAPLARIDARILIEPPRETLYAAIDARFDAIMANGALEEARALAARKLDPRLPVMKAVGAAELIAHLEGRLSLDEAIFLTKRNTRRFAKRQLTWFRHQAADWPRAASAEAAMDAVATSFLRG